MGYRSLQARILPILCCLVIGVSTLGGPSSSLAAEDMFFKDKTIRIVVAYSVGGGFDIYSRTIGRHMGRYIPGNPRFLVQNMTGAGGLISANYMYRKAKPDGLTIGNFPGSLFWARLYGQKGIQFVFRQVRVSRSPGIDHFALCVHQGERHFGHDEMDELAHSGQVVRHGSRQCHERRSQIAARRDWHAHQVDSGVFRRTRYASGR